MTSLDTPHYCTGDRSRLAGAGDTTAPGLSERRLTVARRRQARFVFQHDHVGGCGAGAGLADDLPARRRQHLAYHLPEPGVIVHDYQRAHWRFRLRDHVLSVRSGRKAWTEGKPSPV